MGRRVRKLIGWALALAAVGFVLVKPTSSQYQEARDYANSLATPTPLDLTGAKRTQVTVTRGDLALVVDLAGAGGGFQATATVQNTGTAPVVLGPSCAPLSAAVASDRLKPTTHSDSASLDRVVRGALVSATGVPDMLRPDADPAACGTARLSLAPGASHVVRWSYPDLPSSLLRTQGSARTHLTVSVPKGPQAIVPLAKVLDVDRPDPVAQINALLAQPAARAWILGEPAASLRYATFSNSDVPRLTVVSRHWAQPLRIRDGKPPTLPTRRIHQEVLPPSTPSGVQIVPEDEGFAATLNLPAGELNLPSGQIIIDASLYHPLILDHHVAPGRYAVFATLARAVDGTGDEAVALATIHLSDERTVDWKQDGQIVTDGGTGVLTSLEGARAFDHADDARYSDELAARGGIVNFPFADDLDAVFFSTGFGDGVYPVYVGLDAAGTPTQVVVDCRLLHLAWPK
ncbi:MAG: hypothetical protein QOF76_4440 [Solirubrobacteraceae bacterium]|nr:hypothetical protein [Solirubrobacteraceae bacterium]